YETDPLDADTDDDGLLDGEEVDTYGTDPLDADTDDDGLTDGDEVDTYGTDPLDADTDDGGVPDGEEVDRGTDPLDPSDDFPEEDADGGFYGGWRGRCETGSPAPFALWLPLGLLALRRRRK